MSYEERLRRLRALHAIRRFEQASRMVELRGYWNYDSPDYDSRDIDVDCVLVLPNSTFALAMGVTRIKRVVARNLGTRVASRLHYGVSRATSGSSAHFTYRRGEDWWHGMY
jgi:hypothetical protein